MFNKIKKIIQDDLQRRYEQLEERFLVFEQKLYGHLADRLDGLENQLDQLSELLREKARKYADQESEEQEDEENEDYLDQKEEKQEHKPDDLQDLPGLGNSMEKKLNNEGILTFKQLASLTDKELENLNSKIPGLKIRYERYEWKKEAKDRL
jgi:predicted flap endonuclease-1-like 5' DNA nuclease